MIEILGERQKQLLRLLLKDKAGLTADEISSALGITRNAVRQHLAALENDGLVTPGPTRPSGGRPRQLYALTAKGLEVFPRHYSWFAQLLVEAFRLLPRGLGAHLVLIGDGPLRESVRQLGDPAIHAPGYVRDRAELARWLASADIYVSGMADETFGVSIVEAQASGLPVVGVAAGAMVDRVTAQSGRLGPIDDAAAMARNILDVWDADRAAMGDVAQQHARQYSWNRSMTDLFTSLYPKAFRRAWARATQPATEIRHALQPFDFAIAALVILAGLLFIWWRIGMPGWDRVRGRSGPKEGTEGGQ